MTSGGAAREMFASIAFCGSSDRREQCGGKNAEEPRSPSDSVCINVAGRLSLFNQIRRLGFEKRSGSDGPRDDDETKECLRE